MAPRKGQGGTRPAPVVAPAAPDAAAQPAAAAIEPEASGLRRYPVLSPLRFDGTLYRPEDPEADEVTMTPEGATALQSLGVLGEALA